MQRVTLVSVVVYGNSWSVRWSDGSQIELKAQTAEQARLFAGFTLRDSRL